MKSSIVFLEKVFSSIVLVSLFLPYMGDVTPFSLLFQEGTDMLVYFLMVAIPFMVFFVFLFTHQFKERTMPKVIYIISIVLALLLSLLWLVGITKNAFIAPLIIVLLSLGLSIPTFFSKMDVSLKTNNMLIAAILPTSAIFALIFNPFAGFLVPTYGYYLLNISFIMIILFRVYYMFNAKKNED
jgi:hypothetical protein